MNPIRACIDRELPPDLVPLAARLAVRENAENAPLEPSPRELMPGVMLSQIQVAALTGKLWKPGRRLRVRFLDGDPRIADRCIPFAKTWEKYANLKFDFGNDPNAEIRISFKYRGSWSFVGTDALAVEQTEATMNFGWLDSDAPADEYQRVVTHEFGHALALIHEHQNPTAAIPWNKEVVYRYYQGPPNYWTREQVDINVFTRYSADVSKYSEYDPESIMLYPIPAEFLTDPSFAVGWNKVPSETDKRYASVLYPAKPKAAATLAVDGGRVAASIGAMGATDTFEFDADRQGPYRVETYGRLDTVVSLHGPVGQHGPDGATRMVAKDDDSGHGLNARIRAVLAPGQYVVRVRHFSRRGSGAYEIGVFHDPDPDAVQRFG